jgi:hypothetical protein
MVARRLCLPTLALLVWHSGSVLLAQRVDRQAVPTILFNHQDAHPISVAPFSFTSSQCDGQEDVFFDLVGHTIENGNILRVSADGQRVQSARLPTGLGKHGEWHYSVTSDGTLYAIFSEASAHRLIELSTSNEESRRTTLQLPRYFHVHSFAVLPEGNLMVAGSVPTDETSSNPRELPLLAWLTSDGQVLRQEAQGELFDPSTFRSESFIAAGRLNTFVATSSSKIRVFSARGDLMQTFPFVKPTPNSSVSSLQLVAGQIAIRFVHPALTAASESGSAKQAGISWGSYYGPLTDSWLLVNAVNGDAEAFYEMPADFAGSAMCYLGSHAFLYYQVKSGKPAFVRASRFP